MKQSEQKSETMTIEEVAEYFDISVGTARRRVKDGLFVPLPKSPALKQPRRLLFHRADIEKLAG